MKVDVNRRSFLRGALLTSEGRAEAAQLQRPLGPLPPWMNNLPEQNACDECHRPCVSACEQDIIRIHPAEHALAGFPWLDFSQAGCTFCGECADVCPIGFGRDAPAPPPGEAQIDRGRCLAWNDVMCRSCVTVCQTRALVSIQHRRVRVDSEQCTGCGMCVALCPVQAIAVVPD